jgi:hypothetical protein
VSGRPSLMTKEESVKYGALPPRRHLDQVIGQDVGRPKTPIMLAHSDINSGPSPPTVGPCAWTPRYLRVRIAYAWAHAPIYPCALRHPYCVFKVIARLPLECASIPKYRTACHECLVAEGRRSTQSPAVSGKFEFHIQFSNHTRQSHKLSKYSDVVHELSLPLDDML